MICGGLNEHVGAMEGEIKNTGQALDNAFARSEAFLKISENMIEMAAESGIETEDTPYIAAAQQAAAHYVATHNKKHCHPQRGDVA